MKKTHLLLPILLLATAITACTADYDEPEQPTTRQDEVPADSVGMTSPDNPEKDYTVISAVPVSDDVKAFFDEALPYFPIGYPTFAFAIDTYDSRFFVINNEEQLSDVYIGEKPLPQLDFENYTLIIGRQCLGGGPDYLDSVYLQVSDNSCVLTIHVSEPRWSYAAVYNMYFWGLFPKIEKEIDKNILCIKKEYDE